MWSLPDIVAMNEQKHKEYEQRKASESQEKSCDCGKPSTDSVEFYDIFSDTPMFMDLCQECYDKHYWNENLFWCDDCERYYETNITWERYDAELDGRVVCLNCKTKHVFEHPLTYSYLKLKLKDFNSLRAAPHVIGVDNHKMINWVKEQGWNEIGTVCADSITGGVVVSFSDSTTPDHTVQELNKLAQKNGWKEFVLCIDGAYQFAVNITLYAR